MRELTTYDVSDATGRMVNVFCGPRRLARWDYLPKGWTIEEFYGDISRGMVTLAYVKQHANDLQIELAARHDLPAPQEIPDCTQAVPELDSLFAA